MAYLKTRQVDKKYTPYARNIQKYGYLHTKTINGKIVKTVVTIDTIFKCFENIC